MKSPAMRRQAMQRCISLWKREMPDRISVVFSRPYPGPFDWYSGQPSENNPPVYPRTQEERAAFLKTHEDCVDVSHQGWDELDDDDRGIQHFMVDVEFGCGVMGAMFDAPMLEVNTPTHTMTYNTPIVTDPAVIPTLKSNPENGFIRLVLDCLQYFVDCATKPLAIDLLHAFEGADFLAAVRGETPTLLDLADGQPFVEDLFRLGLDSAGDLFELRRDIVSEYNVRMYGDEEFARLVPQGLLPTLDTDTDVMCSLPLFRKYGMRYKQAILDRFGGGAVYIHTLGIHLTPAVGELHNLTQLRFCDDPRAPRAFDRRVDLRRQAADTPLEIYCEFDEFSQALADHTLPGGVQYIVSGAFQAPMSRVQEVLGAAQEYCADDLAAVA